MKIATLVCSITLLTACQHAPAIHAVTKPFVTPDGKAAFAAFCGGTESDMTQCHAAARETCGGDYTVLRTSELPRTSGVEGSVITTQSRSIEFACTPHV